jgi:CRP-like cAMP-binding protein
MASPSRCVHIRHAVRRARFLDRSPRSADVTALGTVECHVLTRDAFAQLDREAATIKIRLLENLALGLTGMLRQANRELAVLK